MNATSHFSCRLLFCLLCVLALPIKAAEEMMINVYTSAPSFKVALRANPSTGYQWTLVKYDRNLFYFNSKHYQLANKEVIGGGGQMVFTFLLIRDQDFPASTVIMFKYARPWEHGVGSAQYVRVNFLKAHHTNHENDEGWTPYFDPLHEEATFFSEW